MSLTARRSKLLGSVDNWQTGQSVQQCNLRMLTSEINCDVTLVVGREGHIVNAHRYVLISRSCVFAAILSEMMNGEEGDISIPDIEPEEFHSLLVYLYTNDTEIGPKNATILLYAARKYGVGGLEDKCFEYLKENLLPKNACAILEAAFHSNHLELYKKTLNVVLDNGDECLQSPGFLALSPKCVEDIVRSDDLLADETVVFQGVNSWAEAECRRHNKEPRPRTKRDLLGDILKCVRFPLMNSKFFVDSVGGSGLLADDERLKIIVHNLFPEKDVSPFNKNFRRRRQFSSSKSSARSGGSKTHRGSSRDSEDKRVDRDFPRGSITHRAGMFQYASEDSSEPYPRLQTKHQEPSSSRKEKKHKPKKSKGKRYKRTENRFSVQSFGKNSWGGEWEIMKFRTREGIDLCGILLYGPCNEEVASYHVQGYLSDETGTIISGTDINDSFQAEREDVIFEVMFSKPVSLVSRKWYTINVRIRGPPTMYGSDAKERVVSHGITFEFDNMDSHAFKIDQAQIPYLLFKT